MEIALRVVLLAFTVLIFVNLVYSKGCVQLDSYNFDKVASKFKASLVKFDTAYPYGTKQEEYEKVCEAASNIEDLLVVEIPVKDYGDKENSELARKYNVDKDDFPKVKLFVKDVSEPINFDDKEQEFTADNLKKFIRSKSGVYIGLPGCLETFDKLAKQFAEEKSLEGRKKILREAEDLWDKAEGNQDQKSSEVYVKVMRKVIEKGDEFLTNESSRVENVLKGKVSKDKKEEMQYRVNILQSFSSHDEL